MNGTKYHLKLSRIITISGDSFKALSAFIISTGSPECARRIAKHALKHTPKLAMAKGEILPIVRSMVLMRTVSTKGKGAPRRAGASEMTMSRCMCEPMRTAQSLGDATRAVVARPKWA